jgi:hypothetical protein
MSEEIEVEDAPEKTGVRDMLNAVIGDSEGSELDDFDVPIYDKDEDEDEDEEAKVVAAPSAVATDVEKSKTAVEAPQATEKPPLDWGIEVREEWKKLPDSVKKHLHARDQHVNTMLRDGANNRKMGEGLNSIASGYRAIMDAEGVSNPLQAVEGLFKSVATLRMGTQAEKAAKIAQFVQTYGVDINALDNALVGNTVNDIDPMEAIINQRMAPVNQLLEQINQNNQYQIQQQQQQTHSNIAQFAQTAEFLEDVRDDMADLLEGAARRNVKMTLQQAYDKACAINPEISSVMATRKANEKLLGNRNSIAAKKLAASSINGISNGHANSNSSGGLRGALLSAFEEHA